MTASGTNYILRGGVVIDGTGGPRFRGDVAISGDRIIAVGPSAKDVAKASGAREIDVSGKIIAPGFIDVHTHDDRALFASPEMAAKAIDSGAARQKLEEMAAASVGRDARDVRRDAPEVGRDFSRAKK